MIQFNIKDLVLDSKGILKNGFPKIFSRLLNLNEGDTVDILQEIINTGDINLLKNNKIDFTKDINSIQKLFQVLITDNVCYREYLDSDDIRKGIYFGNGKYLYCNPDRGFRLIEDINNYDKYKEFYIGDVRDILDKAVKEDCKIELFTLHLKTMLTKEFYNSNEEEIQEYLKWLVSKSKNNIKIKENIWLEYNYALLKKYKSSEDIIVNIKYSNYKLSIKDIKLSIGASSLLLSSETVYRQIRRIVSYAYSHDIKYIELLTHEPLDELREASREMDKLLAELPLEEIEGREDINPLAKTMYLLYTESLKKLNETVKNKFDLE